MARAYPESRDQPARRRRAREPSGPRFTIEAWKRRWRSRPGERAEARDRRAAPRPAVRGPLRVRAQGPADGAQRRRLPLARAARPHRHASRPASSARPTGSACASRRGDAVAGPRQARALPRRAGRRARRRAPARARAVRPGASSCPAAYRSVEELEGFLEHLTREVHDPGLRAVVERLVFAEPAGSGVPPRALHPRRPPRLPRRAARAHGRGRDAGRRALPAPSRGSTPTC